MQGLLDFQPCYAFDAEDLGLYVLELRSKQCFVGVELYGFSLPELATLLSFGEALSAPESAHFRLEAIKLQLVQKIK